MKNRWMWFFICIALGLLTLVGGWLMPVHLKGVDVGLLERAGKNSPSLVERGVSLLNDQKPRPVELISKFAEAEKLPGRDLLTSGLAKAKPEAGAPGTVPAMLVSSEPITEIVVRLENRDKVLEYLAKSPQPGVQEILRCRELTNTSIFPPSYSSSGQPFDAAISICGLLLTGGHLTPALNEAIVKFAAESNRGGNSQRLEQALLDLMSLGQRLNWGQLVAFVSRMEDPETLRLLGHQVRQANGQLPTLFSAVELSGNPDGVAHYTMNFSETGMADLRTSLRYGAGAVNELLKRNQQLYVSSARREVSKFDPFGAFFQATADYCWRQPAFALIIKWLLYLTAGYFIATALHFARPAVSALELPLQVGGFHVAREILFALGFLLAVLLLTEPFLAQGSQRVDMPFRLRLPTVGSAVPAVSTSGKLPSTFMKDPNALLTLLLFFVLQALLYTACLFKLAEIRRQRVPARMKLRLLENEDHLFDAGLYLGFAGTIISLILVSMGFIKPSLMAAYSSTSFGIIFVSVFKIFHLRPLRRLLLLEAEAAQAAEPAAPAASKPLAAPL